MRLYACVAVVVALLAVTQTAEAREKAECAAAYEEAQVLRQERKLQEAQSRLIICADPVCPGAVVRDCLEWLSDVERAMPSIVVAVQDEDGVDLLQVKVLLDGVVVEGDWVGKALPLNPGAHTVRAEMEGYAPAEQNVVAREGEKSRVVTVALKSLTPKVASKVETTGLTSELPAEPEDHSRFDWRVYTLGAVAIVTGVGGAALGASGKSDVKTMQKCKPDCQESEVSIARTKLLTANVAFGVAGLSAAGAILVWVLNGKDEPEPDAATTTASFGVVPGGGVAVVSGRY